MKARSAQGTNANAEQQRARGAARAGRQASLAADTQPVPLAAGRSAWNDVAVGSEINADVLLAAGFVLRKTQRVRERYRVVGTLGHGTMGQVLAVELVGDQDDEVYALKLVARPAGRSRAEREADAAQLTELLRHEAAKQDTVQRHGVAVARMYALVQLDDGAIGIRMQVVPGTALDRWIDREYARRGEPPDLRHAVLVVQRLLAQLRRLHALSRPDRPRGFVHSDIKPGNVFVAGSDPSDLGVTLLDFGVATAGSAAVAGASGGAARGSLLLRGTGGTLGYAPPGHFADAPTPLSDVHAALVVLYEMIALDLPWDLAAVRDDERDAARVEAAMRAGPRPVRSVRPSVPAADAEVLDAFFAREFAALHGMQARAAAGLTEFDGALRTALHDRLAQLAGDYVAKLDGLADALARTASPAQARADAPRRWLSVLATRAPHERDDAAAGTRRTRLSTRLLGEATRAIPLLRRVVRVPVSSPPPAPPPARRGRTAAIALLAVALGAGGALVAHDPAALRDSRVWATRAMTAATAAARDARATVQRWIGPGAPRAAPSTRATRAHDGPADDRPTPPLATPAVAPRETRARDSTAPSSPPVGAAAVCAEGDGDANRAQ